MTDKEIEKACEYIRTHLPQKTRLDTIDVAIRIVTNNFCSAGVTEDLVNRDDAWLIPEEECGKFACIKGKGWAESLDPETIKMFEDAVDYALSHVSENEKRKDDYIHDLYKLKDILTKNSLSKYNDVTENNRLNKF